MRSGIIGVALLLCANAASAQFLPLPANAQTDCGIDGARLLVDKSVVYNPGNPATWYARWGPCVGKAGGGCDDNLPSTCGNVRRCITTESDVQRYYPVTEWLGIQQSTQDQADFGLICGLATSLWNQCTAAGACGAAPPANPCPTGQSCQPPCPTCPTCPICPPPPPTCTPNQIPANIYATTQEVATWAVISPGSKRKLRVQQMAQFFSTYQPCVESTGRNVMNLRLLIPEPAAP